MYNHRPNLFWPIVLIGVGVIFLLSNTGVIQGNPWPVILSLWPVLLIVLGLNILFGRRSAAGSVISAVLALALVGGVIWLLIAQPDLPGLGFGGQLIHDRFDYPLNEIHTADVSIDFSTGRSEVFALSDSSNLVEGDLQHYGTLRQQFRESGSHATLEIGVEGTVSILGFSSSERWNIGLNPRVAYDLDFNLGVGDSMIDLSQLSLSSGRFNLGVGPSEVRLPSTGRFVLRIDGGVGELRVRIPRQLAVRAEVDTGIGTFNTGSRLRSVGGGAYETEGFGAADDRVTLQINVGVGSITIIDE